jgi:hypothetical protein
MTQTVSAIAVLGPGLTGLALGYRVLNLDATVYSAFTVVDVAETAVLGTYRVENGVIVPDAGGYIVFGTALVDYAEAPVDEAPATAGDAMTLEAAERETLGEVIWGAVGGVAGFVAAIWRYAKRRLTMTPTELSELGKTGSWTLYRGATWREQVMLDVDLSAFGDVEGDELWFTYKSAPETETDAQALLQVSYSAGLIRLNGAAVDGDVADRASITLVAGEETDGLIELYVSELVTSQLTLMERGYFDVTLLRGGEPYNKRIVVDGRLRVRREVTRATR